MNIKIDLDDLQEQHKEYALVIGIDNLIKLSENFGGTQIYIPKKEELIKLKKYKAISEEFNGYNIKELTKKYDVSESTVYRIIKEQIKKAPKQLEGQMDFTDFNI